MSASILVPVLFSLLRFHVAGSQFRPFIWCLWLGLFNEVLSYLLGRYLKTSTVNNNIYVFAESLLLLWQFYRWNLFYRFKNLYLGIAIVFLSEWVVENIFFHKIMLVSSWFRILYSFTLVLLSLLMINKLLLTEKRALLKNAVFLCCAAFVLFYSCKILIEVFWLYGLGVSKAFRVDIFSITDYINVISNLLYAVAILCIPSRQRLTLQY
ncbi:MAG: hypothetical protein JST86_05860 [Bacteroidetes bacterium]|nr:hypothetical protein [Bacteroidota bacterium]